MGVIILVVLGCLLFNDKIYRGCVIRLIWGVDV